MQQPRDRLPGQCATGETFLFRDNPPHDCWYTPGERVRMGMKACKTDQCLRTCWHRPGCSGKVVLQNRPGKLKYKFIKKDGVKVVVEDK